MKTKNYLLRGGLVGIVLAIAICIISGFVCQDFYRIGPNYPTDQPICYSLVLNHGWIEIAIVFVILGLAIGWIYGRRRYGVRNDTKVYIYLILVIITLSLIFAFINNYRNNTSWLFGIPPEGQTFADVVNQNGVQYSLNNPDGWMRFSHPELAYGTPLIYIYGGNTLSEAKAIALTQTSLYHDNINNLEKIIKEDKDALEKEGITLQDLGTIQIQNKSLNYTTTTTAQIRSSKFQNSKAVAVYSYTAYIDAGKVAVIISMQTHDKALSKELFPAFEKLVKSYTLLKNHN